MSKQLKITVVVIVVLVVAALIVNSMRSHAPEGGVRYEEYFAALPAEMAKAGDRVITKEMFINEMISECPDGQLPEYLWRQQMDQLHLPRLLRKIATRWILEDQLKSSGITPSPELVKTRLNAGFESLPDEEKILVNEAFTARGTTREASIEQLAADPAIQQREALAEFFERNGLPALPASIGEAQAKEFYTRNLDNFRQFAASRILLAPTPDPESAKALAKEIIARLQAEPDKFGELAAAHSIAPSAANGGQLGVFAAGDVEEVLVDAISALPVGGITAEPVIGASGVNIIRRDACEQEYVPFEDVKSRITEFLTQNALEEREAVREKMVNEMLKDKLVFLVPVQQ